MSKNFPKKTSDSTLADQSDAFYSRITDYIRNARKNIMRTVDKEMVQAYWRVGREIVQQEQKGQLRANYGQEILQQVSTRLTDEFGRGFSYANIRNMRQFYLEYRNDSDKYPICYTVCSKSDNTPNFNQNLGWSHYRILMRINRLETRAFYEIEAAQNGWSSRELSRQVGSLLYDRLAKSKDKSELIRLACKGQEIVNPSDAIKEPLVLEFLNIPESYRLVESKLEDALISNLQHFLLELGKGFAFIARQKRLTLDGDHFYADLVFYHTILKCYVIIDIKTHELTHADLGQMQLYVNYYDRECLSEGDNPTIGLILCTEKNDAMVKYMLGDKAKQIFASKYQFHLPTEQELITELKREVKQIRHELLESKEGGEESLNNTE